jgi:capsular polysaccharide transport system permease protein
MAIQDSQSDKYRQPAIWRRATARIRQARDVGVRWGVTTSRWSVALAPYARLLSVVLVVAVPTAVVGLYYALMASDQYVAEVRLAVRAPQAPTSGDLMEAVRTFLGSRSGANDMFVVSNYIRSRNIVREIDADGLVRGIFSRPEADYFSRFDPSRSVEALWRYWLGKVSASVDRMSGIVSVHVLAFRREDALLLAQEITRRAENLVNDYSTRLRLDARQNAQRELEQAADKYRAALMALRDFRDKDRVVDPIAEALATATMLLNLRIERIATERERVVTAQLTSSTAPAALLLAERVKALDQQIELLQAQLTSERETANVATTTLARFEELELTRLFSEQLLAIALKAFEQARVTAERQQAYLTVFAAPVVPEEALYPRRGVNTLLVFVCSLILWGVLSLVVAGARDYMV